jgi:hypothetical protein
MLKRRAFLNFSSIRHAPPSGYLQRVSRTAMACRFKGRCRSRISLACPRLVWRWTKWAGWKINWRTSERAAVSFINREAAAGPVRVEQSFFSLLLLPEKDYWA